MMPLVKELVQALFGLAPAQFASGGDRVGLLLGDPDAPIEAVICSVDPTLNVIEEAGSMGAGMVVTHHPPVSGEFGPITADSPWGRVLLEAAQRRIALAAMHTNLDFAPGGMNDLMAARLGLQEVEPLVHLGAGGLVKLVVFVPPDYLEPVRRALWGAGAGWIGNYQDCSFSAPGTGTFRPLEGARPFSGQVGRLEEARELRLEVLLPADSVEAAVAALKQAHPYQEVAYDLHPLLNPHPRAGPGRIGRLPEPVRLGELVARVRAAFPSPAIKFTGEDQPVSRVAAGTGSAGGLVEPAIRAGAQVLIGGEFKLDHARAAQQSGLALIDAGHYPTEVLAVELISTCLRDRFPGLRVGTSKSQADPWSIM